MTSHTPLDDLFFFARSEARVYDSVESLVQPQLELIHETIAELAELSLFASKLPKRGCWLLDVGSGTGAEYFRISQRIPLARTVAIDFSAPINCEFRRRFTKERPDDIFTSCIKLLEADFFSPEAEVDALLAYLASAGNTEGFDVVVTGFMLHHYSTAQKVDAYQRFYRILKPGGVLIHADLFRYESDSLSRFSHGHGEAWIVRQLTVPDEQHRKYFEQLDGQQAELRERWLTHWNRHVLDSLEGEAGLKNALLQVGFEEVGVPLRLWFAAIVWARKGLGDNSPEEAVG